MKKAERRRYMRWAAGGLYGFFWFLQLFCMQYTLQTVSLFSMTSVTFLEVCTLPLSGAAIIYIVSVRKTQPVIGRAIPGITLLYGVYQLLFFQVELVPLGLSFAIVSIPAQISETLQSACVWTRIILVGLAAILIYCSITPPQNPAETQDEGKRAPSNPEGRKPMTRQEERHADKAAEKPQPKKNQPAGNKQYKQAKTVHKVS